MWWVFSLSRLFPRFAISHSYILHTQYIKFIEHVWTNLKGINHIDSLLANNRNENKLILMDQQRRPTIWLLLLLSLIEWFIVSRLNIFILDFHYLKYRKSCGMRHVSAWLLLVLRRKILFHTQSVWQWRTAIGSKRYSRTGTRHTQIYFHISDQMRHLFKQKIFRINNLD